LFSPGRWNYISDTEFAEGFSDLDELLSDWIGGSRTVSILDLSGVPPSIQSDLVGAILRILFEALFWGRAMPEGGRSRPLLLVLEEAHSYLASETRSSASLAVQRIAKEGRKYGIGLMIVSQRPSEIDLTILSQCGTLISLRLSNSRDRGHISSSVTDNLEGLLDSLPILRTGEAIIVGEAVSLPIRALIDSPAKDAAPDSQDPKISHELNDPSGGVGGWTKDRPPSDYRSLVHAWRAQTPRILRGDSNMQNWIPVDSSNLSDVAYDDTTQTLFIRFKAGNVYEYFDVPESVFQELLGADSKGKYFNANIKNRYRYQRS